MSESTIKIVMTKEIDAPVERVFDAWTQPDLLKQWFVPNSNVHVANAEVDLRVGGEYLIHMHNPEQSSDHIVSGTYEEIIINKKIVFNWMWKDGVERTQVTIDFATQGEHKTLITLTHRGFSQHEFSEKHTLGWNGCISNLEEYIVR